MHETCHQGPQPSCVQSHEEKVIYDTKKNVAMKFSSVTNSKM